MQLASLLHEIMKRLAKTSKARGREREWSAQSEEYVNVAYIKRKTKKKGRQQKCE